ncbi:MAG: excinuclease ABC subunit UvrC [Bacteroidales bacterium]|nr:excinuclease ABC subunit UvrC [Bacteroidales bacterium]MBQ5874017.1 excinuclease ABC subunit UvrC [Bacteroidales bacterium]MEE1271916.1 excinuclease ABC subunit UvrC [Bacteroidales bacterium]
MSSEIEKQKHIETILKSLPTSAGVYRFLDQDGKIIYVGKAKNLKNRVQSYFKNDLSHSPKTRLLVKKIHDIKLVVVSSETEALLLENNFIKQYKPRYNILLKDDKTYPWICVSNEEYPQILTTRKKLKDGSIYFGPYPNGRLLKELQELIGKLYPYRRCKIPMTEQNVLKNKYRACLNKQIKICSAPCEGCVSKEEYREIINDIKKILRGDFHQLKTSLREQMMNYAKTLEFEKAQIFKEKIQLLDAYTSKTSIVTNSSLNAEIFAYEELSDGIMVNAMKVVNGSLISSLSKEVKAPIEEEIIDIFTTAIIQLRSQLGWESEQIIVPQILPLPEDYAKQTLADTNDRKKLLDLCKKNALFAKSDKIKRDTILDPERWSKNLISQIQKDLNLPKPPYYMECFDNSNIQGCNAVAACVVFRGGKPSTKEYRHFNIKTVEGPDDYASMKEIINRRYSRLIKEEKPLPDLIIIDGGKGQLAVAVEALSELGLYPQIPIISIAERLEEIYYPGNPYPLCLDKRSNSLKTIQHIRDEAHRFGITHHRNKRSKETFHTMLTQIPGIGEKTAIDLLLRFKSVKQLKETPLEEVEKCIGKAKAQKLFSHLQK